MPATTVDWSGADLVNNNLNWSDPLNWVGDQTPGQYDTARFDASSAVTDQPSYMDPAFGDTIGGLQMYGGLSEVSLSHDLNVTGTSEIEANTLGGHGDLIPGVTQLRGGEIDTTIRVDAGSSIDVMGKPTLKADLVNYGTAVSEPTSTLLMDGAIVWNNPGSTWTLKSGGQILTVPNGTGDVVNKGSFIASRPDNLPVGQPPLGSSITADFSNTSNGVLTVLGRLAITGGTLTQDSGTASIVLPYLEPAGGWNATQLNDSRQLWVQNFDLLAGTMVGPKTLQSRGVYYLGKVNIGAPDGGVAVGRWNIETTNTLDGLLFTIQTNSTATYQPTTSFSPVFVNSSIANQGVFEIRKEMLVFVTVDSGLSNAGNVSQTDLADIRLVLPGSTLPYKIYNSGLWVKEFFAGPASTIIDGKFTNVGTVEVHGGGLRLCGGGDQSGLYDLQFNSGTPDEPQIVQADLSFEGGFGVDLTPTYNWMTGLSIIGGDQVEIRDGAQVIVWSGSTISVPARLLVYGQDTVVSGPGSIDAVSLTWRGGEFIGYNFLGGDPTGSLTAGVIRVEGPAGFGNPKYGVEDRYALTARDGIVWDAPDQTIKMRWGSSITTEDGATVLNPPQVLSERPTSPATQIDPNFVRITGGTWGANQSANEFVFGAVAIAPNVTPWAGVQFINDAATVQLDGHDFDGGYLQSNGTATLSDGEFASMGTQARVSGGSLVLNGGTLQMDSGISLFLDEGVLSGHGSIVGTVSANYATIQVGETASPRGILSISGDVFQTNGTMQFYISGEGPGVGYGQLQIGGFAYFTGATVNVNLVGYEPAIGARYVLFTAQNAAASSPTVTGLDFGAADRILQVDTSVPNEFAIQCVARP